MNPYAPPVVLFGPRPQAWRFLTSRKAPLLTGVAYTMFCAISVFSLEALFASHQALFWFLWAATLPFAFVVAACALLGFNSVFIWLSVGSFAAFASAASLHSLVIRVRSRRTGPGLPGIIAELIMLAGAFVIFALLVVVGFLFLLA